MHAVPASSKKIAVSGSTGWVGSNLLKALALLDSCQGSGLPRQATTTPYAVPEGTTHVVHLAALVHQMSGQPTLADYRRANTDLTIALATEAAAKGVGTFIFVSTAKVMGDRSGRPFTESDAPEPPDDYAISKWEAEKALSDLQKRGCLGAMKIAVLRPPLIHGDGAGANFAKLIDLARSPWPLPFGTANAPRSMIEINRLVEMICALIQCSDALPDYSTFFTTDESDRSVVQIISEVRAGLGRRPGLIPVPVALMRAALSALNKRNVFDRIYVPLQFSGQKLHSFLAENMLKPPRT